MFVDEQCVINNLKVASNYERGFSRLDDAGKVVVKKLREWAGELVQVKGIKRKCTLASCINMLLQHSLLCHIYPMSDQLVR